MKHLFFFLCVIIANMSLATAQIRSSEALVKAMHQKYEGKWYKTMTFVQNTTTYLPNGNKREQLWYEALRSPGHLRINFDSLTSTNGVIFRQDSLYQFRNGAIAGKRALKHNLLLMGFDVYFLTPSETMQRLTDEKFDLNKFSENSWQGRSVYVMGATPEDSTSSQVWVDKERLYTVRIIQKVNDTITQDILFNKYEKIGDAWVAPEMVFKVNGKLNMLEEYAQLDFNKPLPDTLFDPKKWKQTRIGQ